MGAEMCLSEFVCAIFLGLGILFTFFLLVDLLVYKVFGRKEFERWLAQQDEDKDV